MEDTVNSDGAFIAWLIKYYCRKGYAQEDAQHRAFTLGLAMHLHLVTVTSVYQQILTDVQMEELQQNKRI